MTTEEEVAYHIEKKEQQESGFQRWSWYAVIEKLANGDITKFKEVNNQNFINCLNLLSYWKEKEAIEERTRKELKQNK